MKLGGPAGFRSTACATSGATASSSGSEDPITDAKHIYRLGCFLLGREKLVSRPLRLLGLGVSSLREPTVQQLTLL
jgi:hypothetical protein